MMLIVQIIMEASAVLVKLDVPTMVSIDIDEYSSGIDMYSILRYLYLSGMQ